MKKAPALLAATAVLLFAGIQAQAQTNLANLGSDNFTILLTNDISASQTATNLTLTTPQTFGGLFGGGFTGTYNWSAYTNTNSFQFGLFMSAPGASPDLPFTIQFYNAALDTIVNEYQGVASGLTASISFVPMDFSAPGSGGMNDVGGLQFTWDGGGSGTVVVESVGVAVVPEPSTWAMLVLGSLLVAGVAWRRRVPAKVRR